MAKRAFDLVLSTIGLVVLSPVLLALAVVVRLSDGGPVFFRQERVGQAGRRFSILKFRSMVANAQRLGPGLTKDGDPRVTRIGRFLRKTKLDELPQLWNVLRGEMSLVGPRPEVPGYVAKYTPEQRHVLAFKPGITDLATLEFRNEEELLSEAEVGGLKTEDRGRYSPEVEEFYVEHCVPRKIELNLAYASRASVWEDTKLILRTVWALGPRRKTDHGGQMTAGGRRKATDHGTTMRAYPEIETSKSVGLQTPAEGGRGPKDGGGKTEDQGADLAMIIRRLIIAGLAAGLLIVCRWLAYQLRYDFDVPRQYQVQLHRQGFWVIALQLCSLLLFGQFYGIYKYFSLPEIRHLAYAMTLSGVSLYVSRFLDIGFPSPVGVIVLQSMIGFLALGAMRWGWRLVHEQYFSRKYCGCLAARKVAIIGAGDVGARLVRELHARPNLGLLPVAFLDDARKKWGARIHGVPVVGAPEQLQRQKEKLGLEQVVIAMPSCTATRLGEIVAILQKAQLKYVTVPSIDQLTVGSVRVSQLRPVNIADLLGREAVDLRVDQIGGVLKDRTVMVTGAGGSIGCELCRQVAGFQTRRLLLVDQSEVQLFQVEQDLVKLGHGSIIVPVIADILDQPRMQAVMAQHHPAIIFHAAAHKHVSIMETQPSEAIKNNALGTAALAELALKHRVERFVLISTDKAVNPTSVMGASKRLAEVFLQAFARENEGQTRFVAVRFGNVLGSSGSVVPIFERQIAEGGPITVTHPQVVRFFMTIPEAVGLVLQSCAQGEGGEIFVLDMGKPVRILDMAHQMLRLSGLQPDRTIEIKFIGLRPGEKLCEELEHLQADRADTAHPRIKRLTSPPARLEEVQAALHRLERALHSASPDELKQMLNRILPEYVPCFSSGGGTHVAAAPAGPTPTAAASFGLRAIPTGEPGDESRTPDIAVKQNVRFLSHSASRIA